MGHVKDIRDPRYQFAKCICGWTFLLLFAPPAIWLTIITTDESFVNCSIEDFYVAAFQNTSSSSNQSIIYFDLKIDNQDDQLGTYYDALNLTFSYTSGNSNPSNISGRTIIQIANYTVQGFYQGVGKKTHRKDYVVAREVSWEEISKNATTSLLSEVVFRVDLASSVRFKDLSWTGKRHKLMAGADVKVNGITGRKVSKKSITLKNLNKPHVNGWAIFGMIFLVVVIFLSPCWCFLVLGMCCKMIGH